MLAGPAEPKLPKLKLAVALRVGMLRSQNLPPRPPLLCGGGRAVHAPRAIISTSTKRRRERHILQPKRE